MVYQSKPGPSIFTKDIIDESTVPALGAFTAVQLWLHCGCSAAVSAVH